MTLGLQNLSIKYAKVTALNLKKERDMPQDEDSKKKKEKEKYFNMSKAVDEVRHESFGFGETALASAKLLGKGLFNVGRFALEEGIPKVNEHMAKEIKKRKG